MPRSASPSTQKMMRTPDLFAGRRAQAEEAAEIIERIRTDEVIHVESLRLYLGELRSVQVQDRDGGEISGAVLIDRFWRGLHPVGDRRAAEARRARQYDLIKERIKRHPKARVCSRSSTRCPISPCGLTHSRWVSGAAPPRPCDRDARGLTPHDPPNFFECHQA